MLPSPSKFFLIDDWVEEVSPRTGELYFAVSENDSDQASKSFLINESKPFWTTLEFSLNNAMLASAVSVFVSWFVQAINDADTRKHNNSFFIFVDLEIGYSLSQWLNKFLRNDSDYKNFK